MPCCRRSALPSRSSLGFGTVVISLLPPGLGRLPRGGRARSEEGRATLLGRERTWAEWSPLLDPDFERHGCYLLPSGPVRLVSADTDDQLRARPCPPRRPRRVASRGRPLRAAAPQRRGGARDHVRRRAGHRAPPDRRGPAGARRARPTTPPRPSRAHRAPPTRRVTRRALEHMLRVSARLNEEASVDSLLQLGLRGHPRRARADRASPWSWSTERPGAPSRAPSSVDDGRRSRPPRAATSPCSTACSTPRSRSRAASCCPTTRPARAWASSAPATRRARNGTGPLAWNHHWLLIPMRGADGQLTGVIWADEPEDRLLPTRESLQALRLFANQASTARGQRRRVRRDALPGRPRPADAAGQPPRVHRAAGRGRTSRCARYDQSFGLVVLDVDGFKALNDAHGHVVGDTALEAIGDVLRRTLRRSDYRVPPRRRRVRPDPGRGRGARGRPRRRPHRRRHRCRRRRRGPDAPRVLRRLRCWHVRRWTLEHLLRAADTAYVRGQARRRRRALRGGRAAHPRRSARRRRGPSEASGGMPASWCMPRVSPRDAEALEPRDLALALDAGGVVGRQAGDQPRDALADLQREVRGRGAHQLADVLDGRPAWPGRRRSGSRLRSWQLVLVGGGGRSPAGCRSATGPAARSPSRRRSIQP